MREMHVVGAAILDYGRVLAARRSASMYPPFKWEFAGGKVEDGETHARALVREIREELGVAISVGRFVALGIYDDDGVRIMLHVYEAAITAGQPAPGEHSEIRWVEIEELASLDWAEPDIPACKELIRRYGGTCC